MINKNIFWQHTGITKRDREMRTGCKSFLIWFTGLSGAGKSTLARELQLRLFNDGYPVYSLDGDNMRHGLCSDLGFSAEDRIENIRRVGEVGKLFVDAGIITVASFISPYEKDRQLVRRLFNKGDFIEVYVKASVSVCEQRDTKGLYKKARKGLVKDFTGISAPYEAPTRPEILVDTENLSVFQCTEKIFDYCFNHKNYENKC